MVKVDLGCGSYPRGEVGVDIDFTWSNPRYMPERLDKHVGGRVEGAMLVRADLNYGVPLRHSCASEVVLVHVLEHLESPYHTLLEAYRILKPGGVVRVVAPNAQKNDTDWFDEGHIYSFTLPTLRRLVEKAGFRVREAKLIEEDLDILVVGVKEGDG